MSTDNRSSAHHPRSQFERLKHRWSTKLLQVLDAKVPVLMKQLSAEQKAEIKQLLQPGDILLKDDNSHPMGQLMNRLAGSRWSHTVFYEGGDYVIDVGTKPYVAKISLDDFLDCNDLGVFRPQYGDRQDLDSAVHYVDKAIGRPLNRTFDLKNEDSFYCAQLVYCALKQMPHPIAIPTVNSYGRTYVTSGSIEKCAAIQTIWLRRTNLLQRLVGHAPTLVPPLIVTVICLQFGIGPAIFGLICSLALSMFVGNRLLRRIS
ncbi:MAG: hypothetical protein K2W95_11840 [Candidatus Obscuribacterales bacterium]|nr:hypothetical protein [Candidatus Obscuribacterales bacterium]